MRPACLHVCPLAHVATVVRSHHPLDVVSLLSPSAAGPELPPSVERHLRLDVSDIVHPVPGHRLAGMAEMQRLLAFVGAWTRDAPLLIHCYAGVSRSTAAAFASLCLLDPLRPEMDLARQLRRLSPSATPNPHLVALADAALDRAGRMIEAIEAIGRGADCFEGDVFALDVPAHRRCGRDGDALSLVLKG